MREAIRGKDISSGSLLNHSREENIYMDCVTKSTGGKG